MYSTMAHNLNGHHYIACSRQWFWSMFRLLTAHCVLTIADFGAKGLIQRYIKFHICSCFWCRLLRLNVPTYSINTFVKSAHTHTPPPPLASLFHRYCCWNNINSMPTTVLLACSAYSILLSHSLHESNFVWYSSNVDQHITPQCTVDM